MNLRGKNTVDQPKDRRLQSAVDKLLALIRDDSLSELPPLKDLAARLDLGEFIILKAIKRLSAEGIISCKQGRRARVLKADTGRADAAESFLGSSAKKLLELLKDEIIDGKRKTGQPLPKVDYLAAKLHISRRGISQVFKELRRQRLVHKQGKKWIIGPGRHAAEPFPTEKTVLSSKSPVAIVLCEEFLAWTRLLKDPRLTVFPFALCDEMEKYQIRLMVCGTNPAETSPFSPSGLENVRALIQSLGDRYLGTIMVSGLLPDSFEQDTDKWLGMFNAAKKPFVWCDLDDIAWSAESFTRPKNIKLYRIVHDNSGMTELVLDTLAGLGHKRIAAPYQAMQEQPLPWSFQRAQSFVDAAARKYPDITVIPEEISGELWGPKLWKETQFIEWAAPYTLIDEVKRRIYKQAHVRGTPLMDISRNDLIEASPFFKKLIGRDRVTAIVASNDYWASMFYAWLSLVDIKVPDDMSLVSFDNVSFMRTYPIATVDRGYSYRAYCAVHAIFGDIPIRTDPSGTIHSKNILIDRGSLGPPRRRSISL